jgi:DNA-binding transcriptional MerR regulator
MYTSRHVCILYKVTAETVRNWSEEFSEYLSATANPGKGRHRNFTDRDMRVLALIAEMKQQGRTYEDIHMALKAGSLGEPPIPPIEIEALGAENEEQNLAVQVERLNQALTLLKEERDTALAHIRPVEDENVRLKAQVEYLSDQHERDTQSVRKLEREIGRLEGELEMLRKQEQDSED